MAKKPDKGADELVFAALGGLGQIGMNCYLYGYGPPTARRWLMVDLGLTFPSPAEPGVDVVLPDLRFIADERAALDGIVITHAHEDHIGAVLECWYQLQAPVYGTPFTLGMLKAKMAEFGGPKKPTLKTIPVGGKFKAGPFEVELVNMAHSIPEVSGLAIRTPAGLAFHTADWKLDDTPVVGAPTDLDRIAELGKEGVRALICDSTNAMREGVSPSETDIAAELVNIVKAHKGRVAITTFASNVGRIKAVSEAAEASGRKLVIAGRALHRVIRVGVETGYLPVDFDYLDQSSFKNIPRSEVLLLCTGSQGEPRAAIARISDGEHPDIELSRGDLVIFSSRNIPGNEKVIGSVQNALVRRGCEILTDNEARVHVTGHPRRDELRRMYDLIRPRVAIPMHGEDLHMQAHAKLASEAGVQTIFMLQPGDVVRLAPEPTGQIDDIPTGKVYRDGSLIVGSGEGPVRERRKLSAVGIIVVSIVLTRRGDILDEPEIVLDGIPFETADGDDMGDVVFDAIDGTLASIPAARRKDPELVRESVRRAVRSSVGQEWGKRPIVKVLMHVVDVKSKG